MDALNHLVISLAASPWVYVVVLVLVIVDGFFPPLPSESVIVALAAIGIASGAPSVIFLAAVAAAGSVIGDNIAFSIGRRVGTDRFGWMRRPRLARIVDRARAQLDRRAATLIIVARFVPVGRVAVNVVAGATGFSRRRFFTLTIVSGITWALYGVIIGVLVGGWVNHNAILGAAIAIAIALILGVGIDAVASRASRGQREAGVWVSRGLASPGSARE
jgi:membrane-associated protein